MPTCLLVASAAVAVAVVAAAAAGKTVPSTFFIF
jgi:hypothetical protein